MKPASEGFRMLLILGPERGVVDDWQIRDVHRARFDDDVATDPIVFWPASYWPEVEALVEFDAERQRLHLPRLTDAHWQ